MPYIIGIIEGSDIDTWLGPTLTILPCFLCKFRYWAGASPPATRESRYRPEKRATIGPGSCRSPLRNAVNNRLDKKATTRIVKIKVVLPCNICESKEWFLSAMSMDSLGSEKRRRSFGSFLVSKRIQFARLKSDSGPSFLSK